MLVFSRAFSHHCTVSLASSSANLDVDMVVRAGAVELLLDGGDCSATQLFFPRSVAAPVRHEGSAAGARELFDLLKE